MSSICSQLVSANVVSVNIQSINARSSSRKGIARNLQHVVINVMQGSANLLQLRAGRALTNWLWARQIKTSQLCTNCFPDVTKLSQYYWTSNRTGQVEGSQRRRV